MKLKKMVALLLATTLSLSCLLCGCGNTNGNSNATENQSTGNQEAEPEKLVIGIQSNPNVEDYEDNYMTKILEEKFNVDLEFYVMPSDSGEFMTKLSLMAAGGDEMPDILSTHWLDTTSAYDYAMNGVLIPINSYLEDAEMSPNFYALSEDMQERLLKGAKSIDGNIYGLPSSQYESWGLAPFHLYINKAWLDKLGLEIPKTTDDLYDVLTAFVNEDPNGNGIKDEIGIWGSKKGSGNFAPLALLNSFVFYNGNVIALDESGENVISPVTTDEYRQALEYMNKLCSEGLLDSSMFTADRTQFQAILNAETPVVGCVTTRSTGEWVDVDTNPNFMELEMIAPLVGPNGTQYTWYNEYTPTLSMFITSNCKNPELAYSICEYFYNDEMSKIARYGEKDFDWTDDKTVCAQYSASQVEAGLRDTVDVVYQYKNPDDVMGGVPSKVNWMNVNVCVLEDNIAHVNGQVAADVNAPSYKATSAFYKYYTPEMWPEYILPNLQYTVEEGEKIAQIKTDVGSYVDQCFAEFITGQRTLDDANWNEYLKTLEQYGLQTLIETSQTAYDRMSK